jgi:hypothetical protein
MTRPTHRTLAAPIGMALVALMALPLAALANTSEAVAQTGGMTLTLPMPGSGLSVDVRLDAVGNVSQVDLDPVGTYSATKLGPHAVTFENGDGTSQVKINAKGDKVAVKASAPTLAEFVGTGTWSADLFGTGEKTTVDYTVGDAGGAPTIALGPVVAPSDVTVLAGTPATKSGPKGSEAKVRIDFSRAGFTKKLEIKVSVKAGGDRPANLKVTLSGKDKQKLSGTLAELIGGGERTWFGHLCDGTAVSFTYEVHDPGTVAFGAATAPVSVKSGKHGLKVKFDGTRTRVAVRLHEKKDGSWELKVSAKAGKCKHTPAPDPTVNTPVAPNADRGHDHHDGSSRSGDRNGDRKGDRG